MKTRIGFVSNSSSSSFLIVGIANKDLIKGLLRKCAKLTRGCDHPETQEEFCGKCGQRTWMIDEHSAEFGYGVYTDTKSGLVFVGRGPDDIRYVGVNAEKDLNANKTVQDITERFINTAMKLGVKVPEKAVTLHYGEQSTE